MMIRILRRLAILCGLNRSPLAQKIVGTLFRKLVPEKVLIDNHIIYLDRRDRYTSYDLVIKGTRDQDEIQYIRKFIKPGMSVVDIGANIGIYTLEMARRVGPQGRVYAYEPERETFRILCKNVEANNYKNVVPINKAVSSNSGSLKLYVTEENPIASGAARTFKNQRSVKFECVSIKEATKNAKFVKIDIEGGEGSISSLLPKCPVLIEFSPRLLNLAGFDSDKVLRNIMNRHKILFFSGSHLIPFKDSNFKHVSDGQLSQNLLCIPK